MPRFGSTGEHRPEALRGVLDRGPLCLAAGDAREIEHRGLDVEPVHLAQRVANRVAALRAARVGRLLEQVAGGALRRTADALLVAQLAEALRDRAILARQVEQGVDDADVLRQRHWGRQTFRQQELVVLDEEPVAIGVGQLLEVLAELAERILAALEMWVVGAEAVHLLEPVALDHQRQVLVPERRHAHVAPHVLAGLHAILDADLVHEVGPQVHALDAGADPGRAALGDAEAQPGVALEHLSHDHRLQVELGRHVHDEHVVGADRLLAAGAERGLVHQRRGVPPGGVREHGVVGLVVLEQALVAQVDERRHVGLGERRPERIPALVARRDAARRLRARQVDRLRAELDHAVCLGDREVDVAGVDVADGAAAAAGAPGEVERVVVVADARVARGLRGGAQVVEGVVGEHQLGLDAHPVERLDALVGIVGAERAEPLGSPRARRDCARGARRTRDASRSRRGTRSCSRTRARERSPGIHLDECRRDRRCRGSPRGRGWAPSRARVPSRCGPPSCTLPVLVRPDRSREARAPAARNIWMF